MYATFALTSCLTMMPLPDPSSARRCQNLNEADQLAPARRPAGAQWLARRFNSTHATLDTDQIRHQARIDVVDEPVEPKFYALLLGRPSSLAYAISRSMRSRVALRRD